MKCRTWLVVWPVAALVFLAGTAEAFAQEPVDPNERLAARISQFLEGVGRGETQAAYDQLLRGSQMSTQTQAVEALVAKTAQIPERYGPYRAFEQVDARQIGSDLVLMRYLYKCESFPVVWYFTFYRTPARGELAADDGTWRVIIVRFDTRLEELAFGRPR